MKIKFITLCFAFLPVFLFAQADKDMTQLTQPAKTNTVKQSPVPASVKQEDPTLAGTTKQMAPVRPTQETKDLTLNPPGNTVQVVTTRTEVKKTITTVRRAPTVYTEGRLKGQARYSPKGSRSADPAKQGAEKASLEKRDQEHPARITNTTAAQKSTYPARRQAELNAIKKQ